LQGLLSASQLELVHRIAFDRSEREEGLDWPAEAETMIGLKRLDQLEECVLDVIRQGIPGDFIETGAWRGGASIFMRAVLKTYREHERTVWVADSFSGLPKPNPGLYPADVGDNAWKFRYLAVSLEEVQENFRRYELLDDQVRFLAGWFKDTLPNAPIERLAILRMDGDLYQSTHEALTYLYPRLSRGGYAIVDDYALKGCRAAVDDYRRQNGVNERIQHIDRYGSYWQRLG
jgi:O-methyltransferase